MCASPAALSFAQEMGMHQTKCIRFSICRLHHWKSQLTTPFNLVKNVSTKIWMVWKIWSFHAGAWILNPSFTKFGSVSLLNLGGWNVWLLDIPMSGGHSNSELQIFWKNVSSILAVLDTTITPPPNSNKLFRRSLHHLSLGVSFLANPQPRFCPVKIISPGNFRFFKKFSQRFRSFELGGCNSCVQYGKDEGHVFPKNLQLGVWMASWHGDVKQPNVSPPKVEQTYRAKFSKRGVQNPCSSMKTPDFSNHPNFYADIFNQVERSRQLTFPMM